MGPGLFFALLASLAGGARAETAVGLDARGVNPMTAVDNRDGLDVRDELGRPVSAQKVLAELKAASVARAAQAAYASSLPKAKLILPALETAAAAGAWLFQLAQTFPPRNVGAWLPLPRPKIAAVLFLILGAVLASAASALPARSLPVTLRAGRCCPEVLRC